MIRRPPRSTLFPTRRSSDLAWRGPPTADVAAGYGRSSPASTAAAEEHTSELQSHFNPVIPPLLAKKKERNRTLHYPLHPFSYEGPSAVSPHVYQTSQTLTAC